jgi:hypothetical protein
VGGLGGMAAWNSLECHQPPLGASMAGVDYCCGLGQLAGWGQLLRGHAPSQISPSSASAADQSKGRAGHSRFRGTGTSLSAELQE